MGLVLAGLLAATSADARPTGAPQSYDLPYCDEVYVYCLQGHGKAECDKLSAEAKQRGLWRLTVEHQGFPETDMFTLAVDKKPGADNVYIETRQFGCHAKH